MIERFKSSKDSQKQAMFTKSWLMFLLLQFMKMMMLRKELFFSFLEELTSPSVRVEEEDSEEKLTYFLLEILQPQNPRSSNTFIKLHPEEFILQERDHQQLV
jgi:hypothetical protein